MKTIFLVFLLSFMPLFALQHGGQHPDPDSNSIEKRSFSEQQINSFKADPAFDYDRENFSSISLFDIILSWLWNNIFKYILHPGTMTIWEIILYLVAIATIVFLFRQFIQNEFGTLFYKPENNQSNLSVLSEDSIHELDLHRLLDQEISKGHFHNAIRLLYLIALKLLADDNHIDWRIGKTNHEYCSELKNQSLKSPFFHLTQLYENICYGDFEISKLRFESISLLFSDFGKTCKEAG